MEPSLPLSVVIPTYNRGRALAPLLAALAEQARPDDELMVVDDGSKDDTAEIAASCPRFQVRRNDRNLGMVGNWNACLRAARHEWICLVHHDDDVAPGALETLRRACRLAAGPALVVHWREGAELDGRFRYRHCEAGPWAVLNVPTIPSGAVVHRRILEEVGVFDPQWKYSADLEYFPRVCARFPLVVVESPTVVRYRLHQTNYQYETWRKPDFEAQLQQIQRVILGYAGLSEPAAAEWFEKRMTGMYLHMFLNAGRLGDRPLLRQAGRRLVTRRGHRPEGSAQSGFGYSIGLVSRHAPPRLYGGRVGNFRAMTARTPAPPASVPEPAVLFSIIIASYHCAAKIDATLQSVLTQKGVQWECIVVDGGSTDGTLDRLRAYGDQIRWTSGPDAGIYDAMNKGIRLARGKFLYFLGAGDCLRPGVLQAVADRLPVGTAAPQFVYGDVYWPEYGRYAGQFNQRKLARQNISHQAIFYSRGVFDLLGEYDLRYKTCADFVMNIRCFGHPAIGKVYLDLIVADYEGGGASAAMDRNFLLAWPALAWRHLGARAGALATYHYSRHQLRWLNHHLRHWREVPARLRRRLQQPPTSPP